MLSFVLQCNAAIVLTDYYWMGDQEFPKFAVGGPGLAIFETREVAWIGCSPTHPKPITASTA
jgi:hypothetical protein